jgi:hypothetical protein
MLRRILNAFTLIAIALSALGQNGAEGRFVIERIDVRNAQRLRRASLLRRRRCAKGASIPTTMCATRWRG